MLSAQHRRRLWQRGVKLAPMEIGSRLRLAQMTMATLMVQTNLMILKGRFPDEKEQDGSSEGGDRARFLCHRSLMVMWRRIHFALGIVDELYIAG